MKFIIEATGQVIDPRGRRFYYPPWDKWIEDRNLAKYTPENLATRFGIYELREETYDKQFYKSTGFTDTRNEYVVTRTYTLEPRRNIEYWRNQKRKQYKMEGIQLYANANRIEPILEFTGDTMDLVVYKQSVRDAFVAARGELRSILEQQDVSDYDKYLQFQQHSVTWPDPPIDEDTWRDYGNS